MLVCVSMCCLRCVVDCRRCVGCCAVVTVQKKNDICKYRKISREGIYFHCRFILFRKKIRIELQSLQFKINSKKINLHHVKSVIISAQMVCSVERCVGALVLVVSWHSPSPHSFSNCGTLLPQSCSARQWAQNP